LGREILIAAREGGGDPVANNRLRIAIDRARTSGVPADNIKRAIERGAGGGDDTQYEEIAYEGYGPAGVAILVEVQTDNRNRTAGDIRHIFSRNGGNLGEAGCVAWMFDKKGLLLIDRTETDLTEERALELALEAGAEDVRAEPEFFTLLTEPGDFEAVRQTLLAQNVPLAEASLTMEPRTTVELEGKDAEVVAKLLELLEDQDDVSNVYSNAEFADDIDEGSAN
jgi:YebC/PmpR family DNA-binding regulatory protein